MNILVEHQTAYRYEKPVSFSPHTARIYPRPAQHLRVVEHIVIASADANLMPSVDAYGNITSQIFFPGKHTELLIDSTLKLEVRETNPFNFLLASHALNLPFLYKPEEYSVLAPFLLWMDAPLGADFLSPPFGSCPTVDTVVGYAAAIHSHIAYERREEGDARSAVETLQLGSGSCRDTAVLLAEWLRQQGVAARLVSGYLCEFDVATADRRAEGALHAWVEAFLPGAGWLGLDPTNGVLANENFIPLAVGLHPADVMPLSGSYFQDHPVASTMTTRLSLTPL